MNCDEMRQRFLKRLDDGRGRSYDADSHRCAYRAGDGLRCLVGELIPDEHYDPGMEGASVSDLDIVMGRWCAEVSDYTGESADEAALAACLNAMNVPATREMQNFLEKWQHRHDDPRNWNGNTYTGPRS